MNSLLTSALRYSLKLIQLTPQNFNYTSSSRIYIKSFYLHGFGFLNHYIEIEIVNAVVQPNFWVQWRFNTKNNFTKSGGMGETEPPGVGEILNFTLNL